MSKKDLSATGQKGRSLRWKIVIMSVLIVFAAIAVSGGFILHGLKEHELETARDDCRRMAQAVMLSVPFGD